MCKIDRWEEIVDILSVLKCQQHFQKEVEELLTEYPSLIDAVQAEIAKGAKMINIGYEHRIDKPLAYRAGNCVTIYVNY